jgi:putative peptide zinc metalloprotease protein
VASVLYRATLVLSISMLVASKAFLLGMAFAVGYLGNQIWRLVRGLVNYLFRSSETVPFRRRAIAIGAAVLVGIPLFAVVVPLPSFVRAPGVVIHADETIVRVERGGFLRKMVVREGDVVAPQAVLAELDNPLLRSAVAEAAASAEVATLRAAAYRASQSSRAVPEQTKVEARERQLAERQRELDALVVRSAGAGIVVNALPSSETGRYLKKGEPVATLGDGPWTLRVLLSEHDLAGSRPEIGKRVRVRVAGDPWKTLDGEILRVTPAGSRSIAHASLTQLAGGEIPVEAKGLAASEPYFELTVRLPGEAAPILRDGMRGQAEFRGQSEPLAISLLRRVMRAGNRILQG